VRMRRWRRLVLPMALIAFAVWVQSGCIYIPTFNMTTGGKDATKSVGARGSDKRLQPGVSTRANVRRVLGKPFFATSDGRFLVYSWKRQKRLLIYPQCFMALPEAKAFAMTMEFDGRGLLSGFDVESQQRAPCNGSPATAKRFPPLRVTIHQQDLELADQPQLLEQFRAATRSLRTTTRPSLQYK
jgi:hypothetical protein